MRHILLLALVLFAPSSHAGELRLYFFPTHAPELNWSSPKDILRTVMLSSMIHPDNAIGHVAMELSCPGRHIVTGSDGLGDITGQDLLFKQKIGFTLLELAWLGRLQDEDEVIESVQELNGNKEALGTVVFEISDRSCRRLVDYHEEYASISPLYYGFGANAHRREGAGCSAFGAVFVELAGLLSPELKQAWTQERRVPMSLMAGYLGKEQVSTSEILTTPAGERWATEEEPHLLLEFFDPDRMFAWVRDSAASPKALRAIGATIDENLPHGLKGIPAIRLNRRAVPTPQDPFFRGEAKLAPAFPGTFKRADKNFRRDGSFTIRP